MNIYLKGYYGYKNLGDEILLLGVLRYLEEHHHPQKIIIESGDVQWLTLRLRRHEEYMGQLLSKVECVSSINVRRRSRVYKIFGGGEVVTDARPFPHNGWNYLLGYLPDILTGNYGLLGGIGTIKKKRTSLLYKVLLGRAKEIIVREKYSYAVAKQYSPHVTLYHDFAFDVIKKDGVETSCDGYHIINVNPYIWNDETHCAIKDYYAMHATKKFRYIPAEIHGDSLYYELLCHDIPGLELYDRTTKTIDDISSFFAHSDGGIAARLHVLLLLHIFEKPYTPLIYQEKITKILG